MRPILTALCALALTSPALAAAPAKSAPAKPAAKTAPAKAPAAKPAAAGASGPLKIANFDARSSDSIIALFAALGATAKVVSKKDGQVYLSVDTPGGAFGVQMIGCDAQAKGCQGMALFTTFDTKGKDVTLAQINDYNRAQLACRGLMTPDGKPSVMYAVLLNARIPPEEMRQHMGIWQGCLSGFNQFTRDPTAFLSQPHS